MLSGGLIGTNNGSVTIAYASGSATGQNNVGGLIGYAGWLRVDAEQARLWQRHEQDLPVPDWERGAAAIVTVTVAESTALLSPLLHAISHVCAGMPVYRMRSFQDGRPDMRRPPITGRRYQTL